MSIHTTWEIIWSIPLWKILLTWYFRFLGQVMINHQSLVNKSANMSLERRVCNWYSRVMSRVGFLHLLLSFHKCFPGCVIGVIRLEESHYLLHECSHVLMEIWFLVQGYPICRLNTVTTLQGILQFSFCFITWWFKRSKIKCKYAHGSSYSYNCDFGWGYKLNWANEKY